MVNLQAGNTKIKGALLCGEYSVELGYTANVLEIFCTHLLETELIPFTSRAKIMIRIFLPWNTFLFGDLKIIICMYLNKSYSYLFIQGVQTLSDKSKFDIMIRKIGQILKVKAFS